MEMDVLMVLIVYRKRFDANRKGPTRRGREMTSRLGETELLPLNSR